MGKAVETFFVEKIKPIWQQTLSTPPKRQPPAQSGLVQPLACWQFRVSSTVQVSPLVTRGNCTSVRLFVSLDLPGRQHDCVIDGEAHVTT